MTATVPGDMHTLRQRKVVQQALADHAGAWAVFEIMEPALAPINGDGVARMLNCSPWAGR